MQADTLSGGTLAGPATAGPYARRLSFTPDMDSTMNESNSVSTDLVRRRWYQRVGPGLITACVVIGPGSILTSSNVGAQNGYGLSWVVVISVVFMLVYMALSTKIVSFLRRQESQQFNSFLSSALKSLEVQ